MKDKIVKTEQYNAPIQDVWNAISKQEEISSWFIKADFKAEVGYEYTFTHEKTTIKGKVLKANPVHTLVYTWIIVGTGVETTVSWQLEETDNGTHLTLEHYGISNYPTDDMATTMFENFSGGWISCLENLQKYLKSPKNA